MIKIIFLSLLSWLDLPQPADSLRTETINGKLFVIHQVNERETLYSISKRYGATLTGIMDANPNASSGLEVGQLLKIPYTKTKSTTVVANSSASSGGATIIHKVQPRETLFSISRTYNVGVDEIKAWNYMTDNAISVGQDLRIKKSGSSPTAEVRQTETKQPEIKATAKGATHTVAAGETLFSISRQFNVSVDQIKAWNNISDNSISVGQVLTITQSPSTTGAINNSTTTRETKTTEIKQNPASTTSTVSRETTNPVITEPSIKISESVAGTDEIKEGGLAELIEGTEGNRKYLALHRTAKPGTIMKVRNELNNREVFVRIVGPLPNTGVNDKLVIKLSKSAYDRLGAFDPKFRVEVTYYK
jgi:LysM repeat protein